MLNKKLSDGCMTVKRVYLEHIKNTKNYLNRVVSSINILSSAQFGSKEIRQNCS